MIDAGVKHLDAVVFTHEHADHTHGIDDLRPLFIASRHRVPVYAETRTMELLQARFSYCFSTPAGSDYPPILTGHLFNEREPLVIRGAGGMIELMPIPVDHGSVPCLGFRMGNIAYLPDVSAIPDESLPHLEGLACWIIDALRDTPHPSHFSLSEALAWIERMKPKHAVLTISTPISITDADARDTGACRAAYDGMIIREDEELRISP